MDLLHSNTVIDCGILLPPTNGFVTLSGTIFGFVASYSCQSGYVPIGNETRTCQENAQWSGTEPECERRSSLQYLNGIVFGFCLRTILLFRTVADCGPLDSPENGTVVLGSGGSTTVNSIAFYSCDIGFDLTPLDALPRKCEENGQWSNEEPTCERTPVCSYQLDC